MKIAISADSTCDLPQNLIKKYDIKINAMPFLLGEDLRNDGVTGTSQDVYDYVDKTGKLPTTAAYNEIEYVEHFENILKEYDQVIHVSFSYASSSTGLNALSASKKFDNVFVIDSENVSIGFGLLVEYVASLRDEGKSAEEILKFANKFKKKVQISFLIDTLKFLHKGGRCSSLSLLGANLLKIKPRISVTDGKMGVTKKYRGKLEEVSYKFIDEQLAELPAKKDKAYIALSSECDFEYKLIQKVKEHGFKQVEVVHVGPSICIHCGKNTIGLAYIKK